MTEIKASNHAWLTKSNAITDAIQFKTDTVSYMSRAKCLSLKILSTVTFVIHLPCFVYLTFSKSDDWLGVLLTTKDNEQTARHLGFVFVGELGDFLLFDGL
jgi:hypothetical protein